MPKKSMQKQDTPPTAPAPVVSHDDDEAEADNELRYVSVKDLIVTYTLRGADGLNALDLEHKGHLLRKAIAFCRTEGNEAVASALVEYANSRGIVVWSGRGRGIPHEGSTRSYKAQQLGEADPFIRLPVSALGAKKGQVVTVSFRSGVIEVRAGA